MNKNTAFLFFFAVLAFRFSSCCILSFSFIACLSPLLFFVAVLACFFSLLFSLLCRHVASCRCSRCFLLTVLISSSLLFIFIAIFLLHFWFVTVLVAQLLYCFSLSSLLSMYSLLSLFTFSSLFFTILVRRFLRIMGCLKLSDAEERLHLLERVQKSQEAISTPSPTS